MNHRWNRALLPCFLCALALHALVGVLADRAAGSAAPDDSRDVPGSYLRLTSTARLDGGRGDSRYDPHEALDWCQETISCGRSEEVFDGVRFKVGHCWISHSDEMDARMRILSELKESSESSSCAGAYFRGVVHQSAASLVVSPCGEMWAREVSWTDGAGTGRVGEAWLGADALLHVRIGGGEPSARLFACVQWGPRRYLIEPGRIGEFLIAVDAGLEPRASLYGAFYLREGDEAKPVEKRPLIAGPLR